jgi:hypothetical protein
VVEMANDEILVTGFNQVMKKSDGVAPTGHSDQILLGGWELSKNL